MIGIALSPSSTTSWYVIESVSSVKKQPSPKQARSSQGRKGGRKGKREMSYQRVPPEEPYPPPGTQFLHPHLLISFLATVIRNLLVSDSLDWSDPLCYFKSSQELNPASMVVNCSCLSRFMLNPASLLGRISPVIAYPVSMAALQSRFLKTLLFLRATYSMREILSEVILHVVMP